MARDSWSQWSWSVLHKPRKEVLGACHSQVMQPAGTNVPRVSSVPVPAVARAELQHPSCVLMYSSQSCSEKTFGRLTQFLINQHIPYPLPTVLAAESRK